MVTVASEHSFGGLLSNVYIDNFHVGMAIVRDSGYVVFGKRGTHTKEEAAKHFNMIDKHRIARLTMRLVAQKEAKDEARRSATTGNSRAVGAVNGNISVEQVPVSRVVTR